MPNQPHIGKLRNALLLTGLGILIGGLFGLGNLPTRAKQVVEAVGLGELINIPIKATNTRNVRGLDENTEIAVATNTVLPSLTPSQTQVQYLYNDNGEGIPITWGQYPGPSTWPSTPIPPPMGLLPKPDDQINILLLGNDYIPFQGARTDAIMLLTLNPSSGTASVTSFPRDLYVYAPSWSMLKLNTVQPRGGYQLLLDTFEYNFGVRPDHYMNISMNNFEAIIDTLGGIDILVQYSLYDPTYVGRDYSVSPGWVHMTGDKALWYSRSRGSTTDIDRARRQQEVLKAVFIKLMSVDAITRGPEIYASYINYVVTDLEIADLLTIAPLAVQLLDTSRVSQHNIGEDETVVWITPIDKAWVRLPQPEAMLRLLLEALAP